MSTDSATMDNIADRLSATLRQRSMTKEMQDIASLKDRRYKREKLLKIRLVISKCLLVTSIGSILVMMVNTQLILSETYTACSKPALAMKTAVTTLTGFLIIFLWIYNCLQLEIFRNLRNICSFYIAWQANPQRTIVTILETISTIPHPLPFCVGYDVPLGEMLISEHKTVEELTNTTTSFTTTMASNSTTPGVSDHYRGTKLSQIDAALSILMFVRVYQIARFIVLHSRLFRTMLSYSLGALTQTKYNFTFIFKSYMAIYKGYFLGILALTCTTTAAWCIYISDKRISQFADSLWVVYITFFTVGYGDLSPVNVCSQIIAVLAGFSGMFFMGISVTVLSRYLQLTYDEYCMLSFFVEADLQKKIRECSANIIQKAWKQYKEGKVQNSLPSIEAQRELIKALHYKKYLEFQRVSSKERREKQVKSADQLSALFCVSHEVPLYDMKEQMKKLTIRTEYVFNKTISTWESLKSIDSALGEMETKVAMLYKLTQKDKSQSKRSLLKQFQE